VPSVLLFIGLESKGKEKGTRKEKGKRFYIDKSYYNNNNNNNDNDNNNHVQEVPNLFNNGVQNSYKHGKGESFFFR